MYLYTYIYIYYITVYIYIYIYTRRSVGGKAPHLTRVSGLRPSACSWSLDWAPARSARPCFTQTGHSRLLSGRAGLRPPASAGGSPAA